MKRFHLIPWLGAIVLIGVAVIIEGGNPLWFVSPSAFAVCCGVSFVLLLMQYSPAEMVRIHRSVAMRQEANRAELLVAKVYFAAMRKFLLVSGLVGLALGAVFVLAGYGINPEQANTAGTAEGIAVSLIALVYAGFGILFVALPGETAARKKLAMLDEGTV